MDYTKPPLPIPEQILRLKDRGLIINDEKKAAHYLSNISYYRLRAYTYPYQDNADPNHPFVQEVTFEEIIGLYLFDRRLRVLVFNALEKIEIALRTKIIYEFSIESGKSHWYENSQFYRSQFHFSNNIQSLYDEINRSDETFIKHYLSTYTNPQNPPAWMSLEIASLGLLSKIFLNLKKGDAKTNVTYAFGLTKPETLESWMHAIVGVRNICAHHARLWNRRFTISPKIPKIHKYPFLKNKNIYGNKLYAILSCMNYILKIISPGNSFVFALKDLLKTSNLIDFKEMGFPEDWEQEEIWKH
jgi:abortive infection bacteriophage resistance protein